MLLAPPPSHPSDTPESPSILPPPVLSSHHSPPPHFPPFRTKRLPISQTPATSPLPPISSPFHPLADPPFLPSQTRRPALSLRFPALSPPSQKRALLSASHCCASVTTPTLDNRGKSHCFDRHFDQVALFYGNRRFFARFHVGETKDANIRILKRSKKPLRGIGETDLVDPRGIREKRLQKGEIDAIVDDHDLRRFRKGEEGRGEKKPQG